MMVLERWGLGAFSHTEAALSEMRFLCSEEHYIRLKQAGGGVGDSWWMLQEYNRSLLIVNMFPMIQE